MTAAFGSAAAGLLVANRPGPRDLRPAGRRSAASSARRGVPAGNVHDMAIDTRAATDDFFSDRAARPCGRFAAIGMLTT